MRSSRAGSTRHATARGRRAACLALLALACAGAPLEPPAEPAWIAADPAPGALRLELAFGEGADLDLYVTDPALETVYFANTPTRLGGALEADLRCDSAGPRVEVVRFPAAPPGAYRVGVDFPERCGARGDEGGFRLRVRGPGVARELEGRVPFGRFESRVLEFELSGP